jgi:uncharacterized SAM-binding protein YcdF (DUF218 family)
VKKRWEQQSRWFFSISSPDESIDRICCHDATDVTIPTEREAKRRYRAVKIKTIAMRGLFIGALLIVYILYVALSIYVYGNINEMTQADAAIVLGAGVWGDEPSPVFRERINHGIWLYKNGYVHKLILTGGIPKNSTYSDAHIARKYALANGVPSADIFIEEHSAVTQENIFYAAEIAKNNSLSTVIIVSDPLHMKRAMFMAKDYKLTAYASPTPTTLYQTAKTKSAFLAREVFFYILYKAFGRPPACHSP